MGFCLSPRKGIFQNWWGGRGVWGPAARKVTLRGTWPRKHIPVTSRYRKTNSRFRWAAERFLEEEPTVVGKRIARVCLQRACWLSVPMLRWAGDLGASVTRRFKLAPETVAISAAVWFLHRAPRLRSLKEYPLAPHRARYPSPRFRCRQRQGRRRWRRGQEPWVRSWQRISCGILSEIKRATGKR